MGFLLLFLISPWIKRAGTAFYAQPVPALVQHLGSLAFFLAIAQALELLTLFYLPGSVSRLGCGVCHLFNRSRL